MSRYVIVCDKFYRAFPVLLQKGLGMRLTPSSLWSSFAWQLTMAASLTGTIEYEAELRLKNEMARVEAEIQGK